MLPLPNYTDIKELLKKGLTIEAQEKIMALREAALELQEENLKLRERVRDLEAQLSVTKDVIFDASIYWVKKPDESRDGPYCSVCFDDGRKLVRLHDGRGSIAQTRWICLLCGNTYG